MAVPSFPFQAKASGFQHERKKKNRQKPRPNNKSTQKLRLLLVYFLLLFARSLLHYPTIALRRFGD
jgi:hypothetical protein